MSLRFRCGMLVGLLAMSAGAYADTISFSGLTPREQGSTTIIVSSHTGSVTATFTTPDGRDFFVGAAGEGSETCALNPTDFLTCRAVIDIIFDAPIDLMSVEVFGIDDTGDRAEFFAFYDEDGDVPVGDDGFIASLDIVEGDLNLIGSPVLIGGSGLIKPWQTETWVVPFDGLSGIRRLSIRDRSSFSGFAYNNFYIRKVAEPSSLLLLGMGIGGLLVASTRTKPGGLVARPRAPLVRTRESN